MARQKFEAEIARLKEEVRRLDAALARAYEENFELRRLLCIGKDTVAQ